tara:strand:- start:113 stop:1009 length:897 start_codon:yes stop_codon:yes gene_type:complete
MIEITILGTACMQPTKDRNHIGILLSYGKEKILFDCGENIQRQLRVAGLKPAKITKLFISHWHGDHVLGIPGLMSSMGADNSSSKLIIYGPKGTKKRIEYLRQAFQSKHMVEYELIEIIPTEKKAKSLEFNGFSVEVRNLAHGTDCLGYSFVEKDKIRIKPKFVNKFPGPLLGKLQQGKNIEFKGKKIKSSEATYLVPGKKISIIMDTRPCGNFVKLAQDADLLISEATYLEEHKDKAEEYLHLTAKEAGMLANQANVKRLVLLHFSSRYKEVGLIRDEAQEVFKDVVCAEDLMKFKV